MIVSLYRAASGGQFKYLSLSDQDRTTLVIHEASIASSGREINSNEELFFRYANLEDMDRVLAGLVSARRRDGYDIIYAFVPEKVFPKSAELCSEPKPDPTPLNDWIASYLLPSSDC